MISPGYSIAVARRRCATFTLLLLLLGLSRLAAQQKYYPDQALPENLFLPLLHIHGLSDTTFFIGGEMATHAPSGKIRDLWQFSDWLGLNAMQFRGEYPMRKIDTLWPDSITSGNRRLMCWIDKFSWESGWGRQVTFYPFDYAESYYWLHIDDFSKSDFFDEAVCLQHFGLCRLRAPVYV